MADPEGLKTCRRCGEPKPPEDFYRQRHGGCQPYCKRCHNLKRTPEKGPDPLLEEDPDGAPPEAVAAELGVTPRRARQIEQASIAKLRRRLEQLFEIRTAGNLFPRKPGTKPFAR